MRATKTPVTTETKLDLSRASVRLYTSDAASSTPDALRADIVIPGEPTTVRADILLSDILTKKQLASLTEFQASFVQAALQLEGFTVESE